MIEGGAAQQAAEKRATNFQFEFKPIQTAYSRQTQAADSSARRLTEDKDIGLSGLAREQARLDQDVGLGRGDLETDYGTSLERLGEDFRSEREQTTRGYSRGFGEQTINLSRSRREQGIYEADNAALRYFDAHQRDPTMVFPTTAYMGGKKGRKNLQNQKAKRPKKKGGKR